MVLELYSRLFTVDETIRQREKLDMEEDSQPETSINEPDKFNPINWVQFSKEFETTLLNIRQRGKQEY